MPEGEESEDSDAEVEKVRSSSKWANIYGAATDSVRAQIQSKVEGLDG